MFSQLHPASHESSIHSRCPRGQCMKQRHFVRRSFKRFLHLLKSLAPEAGVVCRISAKNVEIVRKSCRGERRTPQCVAGRVPVAVASCTPNDMGMPTATLRATACHSTRLAQRACDPANPACVTLSALALLPLGWEVPCRQVLADNPLYTYDFSR